MGGVTLVDTTGDPEPHSTILKNLSNVEVFNQQISLVDPIPLVQNQLLSQSQNQSIGSFSISDFLVPGLQSKTWEDWQVTDELNPFVTGIDAQDYTSDLAALPFQFDLDTVWDTTAMTGLPADQAFDEFVFDLAPSNFITPETVNVADLIVGPSSSAPSVSPQELAIEDIPVNFNNYQDLALANYYGFTEDDSVVSDSDLGSDLSDIDSSSEDERDDANEDESESLGQVASYESEDIIETPIATLHIAEPHSSQPQQAAREDPHKRFMEETLVARISNDLGPEHMPGLFKILKGTADQDNVDTDEDEEMEVDLARLDETTLVELYQYVETCCMQTIKSIISAEEERKRVALAKAQEERERYLDEQRTPELSPAHSYSSASPSPPHPSSYSVNGYGTSNNKKRSATTSTSCTTYYERSGVEEQTEAYWMAVQHKTKRKKMINNSPICMGGGGTGKGKRIKKALVQLQENEDDLDIGEDDEIDVVGF
ncbi:hypothetical protein BGZ76_004977 [Entomortierella beljakovae]|nr:hypothetical protein BGZ76_004977 [Entomortierella beljakovae]